MASKSKARPAAQAPIQDTAASRRPALPAHRPSGRSVQSTLLTLTGFGATLGGLALTVAPLFSWKAGKIMVGLDYLGVHGGALVMGGLLLVGVAMVLRQVTQMRVMVTQSGEDTGLLESVAADVLQVGTVLEGVESSVAGLKDDLESLQRTVAQVSAQASQTPQESEGLGSEDAIFRLAASMDKVGARIEERMKSQFGDLTERLGQVENSIHATAERIETPAAPAPQPPVPQEPVPHQPALHQTAHHPAPGLHQTAQRPAPVQPRSAQPGPMDPSSLGLLDELDDHGVPSPLPAEAPAHFDQGGAFSLEVPPSPADRWADQPGPVPAQDTPSNPLMADQEIRSALEDLGRRGLND